MKKSVNNSKYNQSLIIWMIKGLKNNIPRLVTSEKDENKEKK